MSDTIWSEYCAYLLYAKETPTPLRYRWGSLEEKIKESFRARARAAIVAWTQSEEQAAK